MAYPLGSITSGSVSNVLIINCTFNGTDYGIRLKSDDGHQRRRRRRHDPESFIIITFGMTNITKGAIVIYSYYNGSSGSGNFGITPLPPSSLRPKPLTPSPSRFGATSSSAI